jgi:hypothetical protein
MECHRVAAHLGVEVTLAGVSRTSGCKENGQCGSRSCDFEVATHANQTYCDGSNPTSSGQILDRSGRT